MIVSNCFVKIFFIPIQIFLKPMTKNVWINSISIVKQAYIWQLFKLLYFQVKLAQSHFFLNKNLTLLLPTLITNVLENLTKNQNIKQYGIVLGLSHKILFRDRYRRGRSQNLDNKPQGRNCKREISSQKFFKSSELL